MSETEVESRPKTIRTEAELDEFLTRPSPALIAFIATLNSPLVILGAGGKMGPTLALLAKRAAEAAGSSLEIITASRFSNAGARQWLEQRGIRTVACDLLDPAATARLPDSENVIHLVGLKFGTDTDPSATWAMNVVAPVRVAERYQDARIVALSTGNVYPLSEVAQGGSREEDPLTPLGEYGNSAVGRERIFEYFSRRSGPAVAMLRLFYAVELRYGVLVDIAQKVHQRELIDLANGYFNCIWQGDANDMILRSIALAQAPRIVRNLCRKEIYSVREVARQFGALLGVEPIFAGTEKSTALVANASRLHAELGEPPTPLEAMLPWIAQWVAADGRNLGKPTHFETRDGNY